MIWLKFSSDFNTLVEKYSEKSLREYIANPVVGGHEKE